MSPRDKNSSQQQHQGTRKGNRMSPKNLICLTAGIMIFTAIVASVTVLVSDRTSELRIKTIPLLIPS
ncbi:MAG: hypothetical protein KME54_11575 [Tolypothrix brevis GSE-NOS-MK-07-07A]|jgi:Flp pilus assembly protein TadB|nr:hypothetical protein [Tolypothrix brevis GSE-NOS-MK-07-07A]